MNSSKSKQASVEYHGKTFPGYDQPIKSDRPEKKMMVLAKKGDEVRLIHFGQKGYKHNYSAEGKKDYLSRSAGIRDKSGNLTKDDKFSANYWARKVLWPKGKTGDGHNGPTKGDMSKTSSYRAFFDELDKIAEQTRFLHNPEAKTDPDGRMSKSQLSHISTIAGQLDKIMDMDDELPGWVTQHISVAQENLEQVLSYIQPRAKMLGARK